MKKNLTFAVALILILTVILVGCSAPPSAEEATSPPVSEATSPPEEEATAPPEEEPTEEEAADPVEDAGESKYGGTLIAGRSVEVHGLDPHTNPAFDNLRLYELVYNELVTLNENLEVIPELAESWDIADDGLTYTFNLREGVIFHDGSEMTSEDVKASYERILSEDVGSPARAFFAAVRSIDTPDPYTVVFNLSEPNAAILTLMASPNAAIVPLELIESGNLDTDVVGTGPFKFEEWVVDNYMTLTRHEDFFIEGLPYLDAIEFRVLPDEASILAGLRAGQIDWGMMMDVQNAVIAREESDIKVLGGPGLNTHVLAFNASREPLTDPSVRLAISCALDRQQLADITFLGEAEPSGPLPPSIAEQYRVPLPELECYERDVERARALLEEAGYGDGIEFSILTRNFPPFPDMAQVVQSQLSEVGISTNLELEEFGIFVNRWVDHDFDAYISTTSHYPDPDFALFRTFHTEGSANVHDYSSGELDELLEEARATFDEEVRADLYNQAQEVIATDAPFAFLVAENGYRIMQPYVEGYKHVPTQSIIYLRETWLNK